MKIIAPPHRRVLVALLPTLLLATNAFAQDTPTVPPADPVTVAPAAPTPAPVIVPVNPVTVAPPPVVATVPDQPTAETPTVRAPAARSARAAPTPRATARTAPAPVAATPAPAAADPAPVAEPNPAPAAAPVADAPVTPPVADTNSNTQDTTTAPAQDTPIWPWVLGGLALLAVIGALLFGRRRRTDDREATYHETPVHDDRVAEPIVAPLAVQPAREPQFLRTEPVAAPIVADPAFVEAAPAPAEDIAIAKADGDDVAALTEARAPVADRPWLEFSMRPVRAGTNVDEALVEIELTIGNSGSVAAENVRVATFLFASEPARGPEMERLLIEQGEDAWSKPVTIAPGEGTRVDATLVLPRAGIEGAFNPVVVADARYRLADGGEGRTSASFAIGVADADCAMAPIDTDRALMHREVEARLYGVPEHA